MLEGYPVVWATGKDLIECVVVLGQQDKASNCKIVISDPTGKVASDLIKHSVDTGGIKPLDVPLNTTTASTITVAGSGTALGNVATAGNGIVSRGGIWTAELLAFADLIAYKEVPEPLGIKGYYANNGNGSSLGYFPESEAQGQFPPSAGTTYNVGRYQFNIGDWKEAKGKYASIKGYTPVEQDMVMYYKLQRPSGKPQYDALKPLMAGDITTAITNAGREWASLPGSPYGQVQSGYTMDKAIAYYQERLAYFKGIVPTLPKAPEKTTPTPVTSPVTTDNDNSSQYKGRKLIVTIGQQSFEYFHMGTKTTEDGKTEIVGQGIRYVMSRRKRNSSYKQLSLKQLAEQVANKHGVKLSWLAPVNPTYDHIDQTGISDYQLLLRECKEVGLLMSESESVLTVKALANLVDTELTLEPGVNLISYSIEDKAIDTKSVDESGVGGQDNRKVELDPKTGQLKVKAADIDIVPTPGNDITGKAASKVSGTLSPGQEGLTSVTQGQLKRVKGLPSTFIVPMDTRTLSLKPLDVLRTKGIPGEQLNRAWVVDKVTHDVVKSTTGIECYSPITTLDKEVPNVATPGTLPVVSGKGWVLPANGTLTSFYGARKSPGGIGSTNHQGWDIANIVGTQVVASDDGVVSFAAYTSGYGNFVKIRHSNGYETRYGHNSQLVARTGQAVKQGQLIALMGSTGHSTGSHCHFEIRNAQGVAENPANYFKGKTLGQTVVQGSR